MINTPNIIFTTEYVAKIGGKYYFVASEMNAVCSIDVQTERVEIIGSIPEEAVFSERVCAKIVVWNGELIFVPMNGKKIWFYRLEGKIWHSLYIKNEKLQRKVRQAFIYKDKLFMVGCHYPAIICVDLIAEDVKYIEAPFKVVQDIYIKRDLYGYFRHDCVLKENLLYFASFITNKVLLFNLEDFHWEYVTVGKSENGYSGIAWDGKFFWLAPNDKTYIVKWDGNKLYREYPLPFHGMNKKILFLGVVFWNEDIIFPAFRTEYTLVFHHADVEKCELRKEQYLFYVVCDDNEIICGDENGNISIVTNKGKRYCVRCSIPENVLLKKLNILDEEYKQYLLNKFSGIVRENGSFGLGTLLSYIDTGDQKENEGIIMKNVSTDYNNGKRIWERLI